jgi:hypothetical protein
MKRGTPRHPKVYDLVQALGLPVRQRVLAVGYLELLWHFTAEFAPQGDVGRFSDDRLESAMDWSGKPGKLIEALVQSRWLDRVPEGGARGISTDTHQEVVTDSGPTRLVVHDWHEHADDSVRKRLARAGLEFLSLTAKVTGHCPQPSQTSADNVRLPKPLPEPKPEPEPEAKAAAVLSFPPTSPSWEMDDTYTPFVEAWREVARETGKPLIPEDFQDAHFRWGRLDFQQKLQATHGVRERLRVGEWGPATDPKFIPLPGKYLEKEYKRPVVLPKAREPTRGKSFADSVQRVIGERMARGEDPLP